MRSDKKSNNKIQLSEVKIQKDFGNQRYYTIMSNANLHGGCAGFFYPHSRISHEDQEKFLKRLVECWNAFDGIEKPEIFLKGLLSENDKLSERLSEIERVVITRTK